MEGASNSSFGDRLVQLILDKRVSTESFAGVCKAAGKPAAPVTLNFRASS